MNVAAYYNEIDAFAAQWLRNLIAAGHIAPGDVDERSIADVRADDLRGYRQCHFFAGIGVWSYALRLAGWPDDKEVWTGSCPCQPFSAAGKGEGYADERHLWPHWHRLIGERRPDAIFGEQVDAAVRSGWLDDVSLSLEQLGYAFGAVDFPAASIGAPHIRQRLYFVADSESSGRSPDFVRKEYCERSGSRDNCERPEFRDGSMRHSPTSELADSAEPRSERARQYDGGPSPFPARSAECGVAGDMGDTEQQGSQGHGRELGQQHPEEGREAEERHDLTTGSTNGFWHDALWLPCRDGKARPTQPGLFPLAHGAAARVGRLRAYGNAICAPQAAEFVRAYLDVRKAA